MANLPKIEKRSYQLINSYAETSVDYIVPSGSTLTLEEIGVNASPDTVDTYAQIIWDPDGVNQNLLSGYGDSVQKSTLAFTGDGTKVMRMTLKNNDTTSRYIGAYFIGELS